MATVGKPQLQGGCSIATRPAATQCTRGIAPAKRAKHGPTHCHAHTKKVGRLHGHPKLGATPSATPPTLFQRLRAKDERSKRAIAKGKARLAQCTFNVSKSTKEQRQQWAAHCKYLDSVTQHYWHHHNYQKTPQHAQPTITVGPGWPDGGGVEHKILHSTTLSQ